MRPHVLLVGALLLGCSSLAGSWPEPVIDAAALEEKAERAEATTRGRFVSPEGILVYRRSLNDPPDLRTGPYGNLADAACWGGHYLGATALRYSVTGTEDARAAVDRGLAGFEAMSRATGVPGLYPRTIDRNVSPDELSARSGVWRPAGIEGYVYRGDVSKDQYAGILFGLGCVIRHVEDEGLRSRAARLLVSIASHIDRGGVAITDRDGEVTTFGDLSPRFLGLPLAANASIALAAFRLSEAAGGPPEHAARYDELVERGFARSAAFAKIRVSRTANRSNDLMAAAVLHHLAALEEDPEIRLHYVRGLARVAAGVEGEGNALFLGYHMVHSGSDPELLMEALRSLMLLPVGVEDGPGRIPRSVVGVAPIHLRPPSSFIWKSDPRAVAARPVAEWKLEYAPVGYLTAYWLLRAHDLIPPCTDS